MIENILNDNICVYAFQKVETFSHLCQQIEQHNPEENRWPSNFLKNRQMSQPEKDNPRWEILQLILDQRRSALRQCCQMKVRT